MATPYKKDKALCSPTSALEKNRMLSRLGEKLRYPSLKDSDKFIEVSRPDNWLCSLGAGTPSRAWASGITPSPAKNLPALNRASAVTGTSSRTTLFRSSLFVLRVFSFRPFLVPSRQTAQAVESRFLMVHLRRPRVDPQALCRAAPSTFGTRTTPPPPSAQATPHTPRFLGS
jgi:hypothetical protein